MYGLKKMTCLIKIERKGWPAESITLDTSGSTEVGHNTDNESPDKAAPCPEPHIVVR